MSRMCCFAASPRLRWGVGLAPDIGERLKKAGELSRDTVRSVHCNGSGVFARQHGEQPDLILLHVELSSYWSMVDGLGCDICRKEKRGKME